MILVIDNYDSFTFNLVHYFGELGEQVETIRNDELSLEQIEQLKPDSIVISPGPCTPNQAGVSLDVVERFAGKIPILGVCLGHQCIGQFYGGDVVHAKQIMHGKVSSIQHSDKGVFQGLKKPFTVTRYHSLVVERATLPDCLEVTAWSKGGEIMGLRHKDFLVEGVQFHPESILSEHGHDLLSNFLSLVKQKSKQSGYN